MIITIGLFTLLGHIVSDLMVWYIGIFASIVCAVIYRKLYDVENVTANETLDSQAPEVLTQQEI